MYVVNIEQFLVKLLVYTDTQLRQAVFLYMKSLPMGRLWPEFIKFRLHILQDYIPEPMLSSACCTGPGPDCLILKFWVIGSIPSKLDTVRPTQLTSSGSGCSHQLDSHQEFHVKCQSISNPGSHHQKSSILPRAN